MKMKKINEIAKMYFNLIEDNRNESYIKYRIIDILKVLLIGAICGLEEISEIIDYIKEKREFFSKEFDIKEIPSKSTVQRVLSMIDSKWLSIILYKVSTEILLIGFKEIHLDGKVIKSTEMIKNFDKALNVVTAYTETGISLYQESVNEKTNEIPTAQEIIKMIDVKEKVITADALHCQKRTVETIIEKNGNYVIQLKSNQKNMYEEMKEIFDEKMLNKKDFEIYETIEKSHGRIETRKYIRVKNKEYYKNEYYKEYFQKWKGLKDIIAVIRIVEENGKKRKEKSIYITSLDEELEKIAKYIRNHWLIESMHHILDVSFNEDKCQLASKNAQENMNIIRKLAISIHKNRQSEGKKAMTIKRSMFNCLINEKYLKEVVECYITKLCIQNVM